MDEIELKYPVPCWMLRKPDCAPLIVLPLSDVDTTACQVWLDAGSILDPLNRAGVAHLYEHLIYRNGDPIDLGSAEIHNAFTGYDYATHSFKSLPDNIVQNFNRLVSAFSLNNINEGTLDAEKLVIENEMHHLHDTRQGASDLSKIRKLTFPEHAYGMPILGCKQSLSATTLEDVKDFSKRNGTTGHCVVISGAISLEGAKSLYNHGDFIKGRTAEVEQHELGLTPRVLIQHGESQATIQISIQTPLISGHLSEATSAFAFFVRKFGAKEMFPTLYKYHTVKQLHARRIIHRHAGMLLITIVLDRSSDVAVEPAVENLRKDIADHAYGNKFPADALPHLEEQRSSENYYRLQDHLSHAQYLGWLAAVSTDLNSAIDVSFSKASLVDLRDFLDQAAASLDLILS